MRAPGIILPADAAHWSDDRWRIVLRHELAPITRHDAAIQITGELLRILQPLNPLVWIACRRLRQESEYACDDAVLEARFEPAEYAQCLGRLALWYYAPVPLAPAGLGMLWNQHVVLLRVKRLLQRSATPRALSLLPRSIV